MKIKVRLTAMLLAVTVLFTLGASGCGSKSVNAEVTLSPMTASAQDTVFMNNPDRGFRTDFSIKIEEFVQYAGNKQQLMNKIGSRFSVYFGQLEEPCSLAYAYIYLTKWHREELPEDALTVIRAIFEYCRIKSYKLYVSFAYNDTYAFPWYNSKENEEKLASVCADERTILNHIDQLAPIIAEYKDCCFSIKNGFIGSYGEWAYPYQYPEVDYDKITKAIVDNLCAPNGLYFSHRLPRYTVSVKEKYPDWENAKWIGFNNCAFYGEQTNEGWASEKFQVGDAEGWWEYVCKNGAYAPVTGEMYTSEALNRYNAIVTGKQAILELAHHWHVTLSFWHGKYDCSAQYTNVMETWERQELSTQWLDANSIIYDPNWFVDDNGNAVSRNCYEFIRDHLGYKIVADKVNMSTADGKMTVSMTLKNYGFSAAFNLESGFAILDEDYNVVSKVAAGEPDKWYSHDPENYTSTVVPEYTVSGELEAPSGGGKYYVAFYLQNTMGVGAILSNRDVPFENGFNILYEF